MRSASTDNSNINLKNILSKRNYDFDSDTSSAKNNTKVNNNLKNTPKNAKDASNLKIKQRIQDLTSDSETSSNVKKPSPRLNKSLSPPASSKNKKNVLRNSRSDSSKSESSRSRSRTRTRTQTRSRSRSYSSRSRSGSRSSRSAPLNKAKSNSTNLPVKPKPNVTHRQTKYNSAENYRQKSESNLSIISTQSFSDRNVKRPYLNHKPVQKQNGKKTNQRPPTDQFSETAIRVMSAQRLKNNDLQNRITELNLELEKLRDENKTLKRVHHREEIALKKLETQDVDVSRMVRNHMEEANALKEIIKTVKNENRRLNSTLIDKDEEIRTMKKKYDELKRILKDKKLLDSAELSRKLEQCEKDLSTYKTKNENLERKLDMLEKNHKHEIGVEVARHKETQKQLHKLNEDYKELKVKLEEKERALDIANIYSMRQNGVMQNSSLKASTQSLNNGVMDSPHEKRKEYERRRVHHNKQILLKEERNAKETPREHPKDTSKDQHSREVIKEEEKYESSTFLTQKYEKELEMQKEDASKKQLEIEAQIRQQEVELKRKDAAERARRQEQQQKEEKLKKQKEEEERLRKLKEEEEKLQQDLIEERKRRDKEKLEEEERKKRWVTDNTINTLNEEREKNAVEKSKKDELLAKLSLISSTANTNNLELNHHSNSTIINHNSKTTITNTNGMNGQLSHTIMKQNNDSLFGTPAQVGFGNVSSNPTSTNSNMGLVETNKSTLPPKPSNFNNLNTTFSATTVPPAEYKFTPQIENLHEGKPSWPKGDNKSELLTKLFGESNSASSNSRSNQQSKLDKVDDIFSPKSSVSNQNLNNTSKPNTNSSSKVNLLPWEIQDINFNTTNPRQTGNHAYNSNTLTKNDHVDFFSKLNSNNESKTANYLSANTNGFSRPKLENKIIVSTNHNKLANSYTEDIEELTL